MVTLNILEIYIKALQGLLNYYAVVIFSYVYNLKQVHFFCLVCRDDGLAVTDTSPKMTENIKKEICRIFKKHGLQITIEANKQVVNFLDVTLNLSEKTYCIAPTRNLATTSCTYTAKAITHHQSQEPYPQELTDASHLYHQTRTPSTSPHQHTRKALDESGYNYYKENNRRKNRPRNDILWYNPPFSKNVNTNIGQRFLSLINRCFHKDHSLRKIFNKNKVKISYSCMPNIKQTIDNQNKQKLRLFNNSATKNKESKPCNCRKKDECPFDGNCLQAAVIYQPKVTRTDNNTHETYAGLTKKGFKMRYRNHTASFRNIASRKSTELSKYVWSLKDNNINHVITWQIIARAKPYNSASKRCNLCLLEKFIICEPHRCTLNKRNELVSGCRHRKKSLQRSN